MRKHKPEIVIEVKNLDLCRSFYQTMLPLGIPVFNSNFRIEFDLGKFILILERVIQLKQKYVLNPAWTLEVEKPLKLCRQLQSYGFKVFLNEEKINDHDSYLVNDPENNTFIVASSNQNNSIPNEKISLPLSDKTQSIPSSR